MGEQREAELLFRIEELKERLHKCDGMANEVNILTRENRGLYDRIKELEEELAELRAERGGKGE